MRAFNQQVLFKLSHSRNDLHGHLSGRAGEVHATQREAVYANTGFIRLLDRMENGDVLIVTKLDRLGRNAMDIRKTVEQLAALDIRVHCLALGGVDLTSPAGKMTMQVISAVAEFERDLLLERTIQVLRGQKRLENASVAPHPERGTKANSDRAPKCWHQYQCYCPGI